MQPAQIAGHIGRLLYGLVLLAAGAALAIGGVKLITLGGSFYYLPAGLAALAAGGAVLLGRWRLAAWIYLGLLAVTFVWSLAEAGLAGWPLMPRLFSPFVLGIPLLVVALARGEKAQRLSATGLIAAAVLLVAAVWATSGFTPVTAQDREIKSTAQADGEWLHFGQSLAGTFFSPLAQIDRDNVGKLEIAWQQTIGPMPAEKISEVQTVPLKAGDKLYICDSYGDVIALDEDTGKQVWKYESHSDVSGLNVVKCRGVAYYAVPDATGTCSHRIYGTALGGRLTALDAETGEVCTQFGVDGHVDLTRRLKQRNTGYYWLSSAPTVVDGKIVIGGGVADGQHVDEPSGVVRAYDAVTGKLSWAWDLGAEDGRNSAEGDDYFTSGTPNSWGPMAADEALGLVYVPTGNSTPDYWGGHRTPASNKYASSVVALDMKTGEPRWHFQTAHYDVWDYDVGSQPVLVDIRKDGKVLPAIIQNTKRGQVFVLDRRDGKPIYPVVEKPAPQEGAVENLAPTQPWSTELPDLGSSNLTEGKMWGLTALDQLWCRIKFRDARYEGSLTPPGVTSSIADPGYIGGVDWGSSAVDPDRQLALTLSNRIVNYIRLVPRSDPAARDLKANSAGRQGLFVPQEGTPYAADIKPFMSPLGVPCQQPPYSYVVAIDLGTGHLAWQRPLGSARDLGPMGMRSHLPITIGTPTFGGPMITAGGLVFTGGSQDHAFRAFDSETGKLLFEADLPSKSNTRAMSFRSDKSGRQYIVIASDAPMRGGKVYGTITAFALPAK